MSCLEGKTQAFGKCPRSYGEIHDRGLVPEPMNPQKQRKARSFCLCLEPHPSSSEKQLCLALVPLLYGEHVWGLKIRQNNETQFAGSIRSFSIVENKP